MFTMIQLEDVEQGPSAIPPTNGIISCLDTNDPLSRGPSNTAATLSSKRYPRLKKLVPQKRPRATCRTFLILLLTAGLFAGAVLIYMFSNNFDIPEAAAAACVVVLFLFACGANYFFCDWWDRKPSSTTLAQGEDNRDPKVSSIEALSAPDTCSTALELEGDSSPSLISTTESRTPDYLQTTWCNDIGTTNSSIQSSSPASSIDFTRTNDSLLETESSSDSSQSTVRDA